MGTRSSPAGSSAAGRLAQEGADAGRARAPAQRPDEAAAARWKKAFSVTRLRLVAWLGSEQVCAFVCVSLAGKAETAAVRWRVRLQALVKKKTMVLVGKRDLCSDDGEDGISFVAAAGGGVAAMPTSRRVAARWGMTGMDR